MVNVLNRAWRDLLRPRSREQVLISSSVFGGARPPAIVQGKRLLGCHVSNDDAG